MTTEMAKRESSSLESVDERPTVRPNVDIYENRDEYVVVADLPAVSKDALSIRLEDSELTIEGTVVDPMGDSAIEREFRLVNYRRSFVLPEFVDRAKVSAELTHGVLTLHLPKSEAVKPRRIQVRAG